MQQNDADEKMHTGQTQCHSCLQQRDSFVDSPNPGFRVWCDASTMTGFTLLSTDC